MAEIIHTKSIGKNIAKVDRILLDQTSDTVLMFQPQIHGGGVRGWLVRFKKERGKDWEEIDEKDFRKLKLYEGVKIELRTEPIQRLIDGVQKCKLISQRGIGYGHQEFVVGKKDEVILGFDPEKVEYMKAIFANPDKQKVLDFIVKNNILPVNGGV